MRREEEEADRGVVVGSRSSHPESGVGVPCDPVPDYQKKNDTVIFRRGNISITDIPHILGPVTPAIWYHIVCPSVRSYLGLGHSEYFQ